MRSILVLFLLLALAGSESFAQLKEYNFQSYRQAPTRFRGAQIDPRLDGQHLTSRPGALFLADSRNAVGLDLSGFYFDIVNDWEFKEEVFFTGTVLPSVLLESNDDDETELWSLGSFFGFSKVRENYVDYNRWFWGFAAGVNTGYGYQDLMREGPVQSTDQVSQEVMVNPNVALRLGWGRLENITNAWHAYRILNRLNYTQVMKRDFTHLELNRLGQFLDELKTERIFDDRLRYIAQLQYLDYFLRDEFGLEAETIKYYVELNDMWAFGISENRLMGQKLFFDFGGLWTYQREMRDIRMGPNDIHLEGSYAGTYLSFNYIKAMPIKRDYQLNLTATLYGDYLFGGIRRNGPDFTDEVWSVQPGVEVLYAFYPTTRTEWEWTNEYRSVWGGRRLENGQDQTFERQDVWSSGFVFNYFIRTTTTLSGRVSVNYLSDSDRPFLFPDQGRYLMGNSIWNVQYDVTFSHIFF